MEDHITITLPLPDRKLSPNARVHWAAKARAVKFAKERAYYVAKKAGVGGLHWPAATMRATFFFKVARNRDRDNLAAMLKSVTDGIVAAGLLENDCYLIPLPVEIVNKTAMERVELEFAKTDRMSQDGRLATDTVAND